MKNHPTSRKLFFGILLLAFLFRFWGADNRDLLGDEGVDAFRGVGYLDYLGSSFQTQPIDWYKNQALPRWTMLSFHDFPPLAMAIQHAFFRVLGDSILVARLPAIILGTLSALVIYLISRKFLKEDVAILVTFLFSTNSVMVWIFRASILEPILLFFILLNIYFFFKFLENRKFWWLFGGTLGLVALTKYTGVFLLPVYLSYLFFTSIFRGSTSDEGRTPRIFKDWRLYASFLITLLLFAPVLIYNFHLYQATGHFDLQIAYFLGQETPEWTGLVGKIQAPFSEIWENLTSGAHESDGFYSPVVSYQFPFLVLAVIGLFYLVYEFLKKAGNGEERKFTVFLVLYLIFATLLLMKIGSAQRFLTLYGPVFVIFSSVALNWLWTKSSATADDRPKWAIPPGYSPTNSPIANWFRTVGRQFKVGYFIKFLVYAFLIWEFFYSVNRNFIQIPDYGIAKLDNYLGDEFRNKESAVIPESDNPHLNEIIKKFANNKKLGNRELFMIVYNDNVELPILEWIFYRRFFYHSIPALFVENFNKAISIQGEDYFRNFAIYFIQSTEHTLLNQFKREKTVGLEFENRLQKMGYQPVKIIYGHDNLPMFRVYKFSI